MKIAIPDAGCPWASGTGRHGLDLLRDLAGVQPQPPGVPAVRGSQFGLQRRSRHGETPASASGGRASTTAKSWRRPSSNNPATSMPSMSDGTRTRTSSRPPAAPYPASSLKSGVCANNWRSPALRMVKKRNDPQLLTIARCRRARPQRAVRELMSVSVSPRSCTSPVPAASGNICRTTCRRPAR